MLQKIIKFIKYNNAFTIGIMVIFLGTGMSFAASPELRNSVYSSTEVVTSVDNSAIVSANLDSFNFNLKINSVTEDEKNYYVNYVYKTLAIKNSIWQETPQEKMLTVTKASLENKDLGLYVAKELGDNVNYELSYLKKVQDLQKGLGVSKKVITTQYSGLIGKLLDPKEKIIEGYQPILAEVVVAPDPRIMDPTVPTPAPSLPTPAPLQLPSETNHSVTEPTPAPATVPAPKVISEPAPEPTPPKAIDENEIKRIVEQYLAEHKLTATPTPPPIPTSVTPTVIVTPTPVPETISPPSPTVATPTPPPIPASVTPTVIVTPTPVPETISPSTPPATTITPAQTETPTPAP